MEKYSALLNELKEYGLNPSHWEIKIHGSKVKVNHIEDKHLELVGEVAYTDQKPHWFNLEWLSGY